MADSARRIFSLRGLLAESILAIDIKSRADARKRGPFVGDDNELMLWAQGVWRDNRRLRRPCFKHYPSPSGGRREVLESVQREYEERTQRASESQLHKKAKHHLAEFLRGMVSRREPLPWFYKDPEATDFALTGDLLCEVTDVLVEDFVISLPFGVHYRPDIALVGNRINQKPILLGIVELELTHEAELLKCLLCKSTGAPLFLIDLTETQLDSIDAQWCRESIAQTTLSSADGRRRNFIFLHNMLYPLFADIPRESRPDDQHQFLIFVRDESFDQLRTLLSTLRSALALSENDVRVSPVRLNPSSKESLAMFDNEGSIAGKDWRQYNDNQYLRLAITRPSVKSGPLYKFHLVLAKLLTLHFDALVGYKIGRREHNSDRDNPVWVKRTWDSETTTYKETKLLPKCVSEPVRKIVEIVNSRHLEK